MLPDLQPRIYDNQPAKHEGQLLLKPGEDEVPRTADRLQVQGDDSYFCMSPNLKIRQTLPLKETLPLVT